jgi:MFS family permease
LGESSSRRRALVASCAVGAGASWHLTNAGALATPLEHHYGVGLATVSLLTSILFFTELAAMLPSGGLIDRFGPRAVCLGGLVVALLPNLPLSAGGGIVVALVLRAVIGAGAAAAFIGGAAYVQRTAGTAVAQGIYGATGLAAGGVALVVVPPLSDPLGWRAPWVLAAVGTLACLAVAAIGPPTPPVRRRGGAGARRPSVLRVAASPFVARLGALHAASFGFSVVLGNWCVTLLEHAGHGKDFAGVAGALTLLGGVIGRPGGGWLARSGGRAVYLVLYGGILIGAFGALLLAADPGSAVVALIGAGAVGIGGGLPFGIVLSAAGRGPRETAGVALAAMNSYSLGAIIAATPLLGLTFSLPGSGRIGFAVAAGVCLLALAVVPATVTSPAGALGAVFTPVAPPRAQTQETK